MIDFHQNLSKEGTKQELQPVIESYTPMRSIALKH